MDISVLPPPPITHFSLEKKTGVTSKFINTTSFYILNHAIIAKVILNSGHLWSTFIIFCFLIIAALNAKAVMTAQYNEQISICTLVI